MIVPFAPGGASDFVGRILQPRLSELLGQQVVVENRAGASGNIGLDAAAKAAPDGYTIFLGNVGTVAINPACFTKLGVTPTKDFIAVTQVVDVPGVLVIHPDVKANTREGADRDREDVSRQAELRLAGQRQPEPAGEEVFRKVAGNLDMVHVPYKGGAGPAVAGPRRRRDAHDVRHRVVGDDLREERPHQAARRDQRRSGSPRSPTRRPWPRPAFRS